MTVWIGRLISHIPDIIALIQHIDWENLKIPVHARFKSKHIRDEFYKQRNRIPIGDDTAENIYINEDLT